MNVKQLVQRHDMEKLLERYLIPVDKVDNNHIFIANIFFTELKYDKQGFNTIFSKSNKNESHLILDTSTTNQKSLLELANFLDILQMDNPKRFFNLNYQKN